MVASFQRSEPPLGYVPELLRPALLPNGKPPESRVLHSGISWERFIKIDETRGTDISSPRFWFYDELLEVMTTSNEHERVAEWCGLMMEMFASAKDLELIHRGSASIRNEEALVSAEPDKAWCIGSDKAVPDIVLEVALTSGGIRKLDLYAVLQVPEVWIYRFRKLDVFMLQNMVYVKTRQSGVLRDFPLDSLERALELHTWREARKYFAECLSVPFKPRNV